MLTVLHLKVSRDGQLDRRVRDMHYRCTGIGEGRAAAIAEVLRAFYLWEQMGLSYETVAELDDLGVDDMDRAYELTNHIDKPWWDNAGVKLVGEPKQRSTSVGDLIYVDGGKRTFFVDSFGFTEIRV
jgi:hypothetical protein